MFQVTKLLLGTTIGGISGLVTSILFLLLTLLLPSVQAEMNLVTRALVVLIPFGFAGGAVIGGLSTSLRNTLNSLEMMVISILLSLAMGSAIIMAGQFDARSRMPIAIYGLAVLNGIIVLPLVQLILAVMRDKDRRSTVG